MLSPDPADDCLANQMTTADERVNIALGSRGSTIRIELKAMVHTERNYSHVWGLNHSIDGTGKARRIDKARVIVQTENICAGGEPHPERSARNQTEIVGISVYPSTGPLPRNDCLQWLIRVVIDDDQFDRSLFLAPQRLPHGPTFSGAVSGGCRH